ncbi:hypothetical protein SDC9_176348 [bioreactor metagenome]|uniref:Uncharacterized protein n=1 Tax=bioreactor metagenome TaxID=1076179 RepID=A0A645GZ53_9ZZZZ
MTALIVVLRMSMLIDEKKISPAGTPNKLPAAKRQSMSCLQCPIILGTKRTAIKSETKILI